VVRASGCSSFSLHDLLVTFWCIPSQVIAERAAGIGGVPASSAVGARRLAGSRFKDNQPGGVTSSGAPVTPAAAAAAATDPFIRALERLGQSRTLADESSSSLSAESHSAEIAALERIAAETGREIVYGGTSVMTPRDLLDQLLRTDQPVDTDGAGAGLDLAQ